VKAEMSSPIEDILDDSRTIAVVGLSDKPGRASLEVAAFLKEHGYKIIPINPAISEVLGERAYPDLLSVPAKIDVVDIFRKSDEVGPIVDAAIKKGARVVWMQLGIVNAEAAQEARKAGLEVVMDRCMKKEYKKHHGEE
jgi:uncharacterized protein